MVSGAVWLADYQTGSQPGFLAHRATILPMRRGNISPIAKTTAYRVLEELDGKVKEVVAKP